MLQAETSNSVAMSDEYAENANVPLIRALQQHVSGAAALFGSTRSRMGVAAQSTEHGWPGSALGACVNDPGTPERVTRHSFLTIKSQ